MAKPLKDGPGLRENVSGAEPPKTGFQNLERGVFTKTLLVMKEPIRTSNINV